MRVVFAVALGFVVGACVTPQVIDSDSEVLGIYDLVSLGSEPVPNYQVTKLWIDFTSIGTFEFFQEPRNTGLAGLRGRYEVIGPAAGCVRAELWSNGNPGERIPIEFCGGVMNFFGYHALGLTTLHLDGPMVFHKRR